MASNSIDTFHTAASLEAGGDRYRIYRLDSLARETSLPVDRLPFSLKVLLENLLRCEDDRHVTGDDIRALAGWDPAAKPDREIAFMPARILLQDLTGVPAIVDLAAMRDGIRSPRRRPGERINPLQPVPSSSSTTRFRWTTFGSETNAFDLELRQLEFSNGTSERYAFLKLGTAGVRQLSASCRRTPASSTRSTSSIWPAWSSPTDSDGDMAHGSTPTRWSAPTRTRR